MSFALNRSSAVQHLKHVDAIKIHDGITFNFYMGLPHVHPRVCIHYKHKHRHMEREDFP